MFVSAPAMWYRLTPRVPLKLPAYWQDVTLQVDDANSDYRLCVGSKFRRALYSWCSDLDSFALDELHTVPRSELISPEFRISARSVVRFRVVSDLV